jgi:hypothetical protein
MSANSNVYNQRKKKTSAIKINYNTKITNTTVFSAINLKLLRIQGKHAC